MSKPSEQHLAVLKIVQAIPAWSALPKSIQGFLCGGLAERNLLEVLRAAGMAEDVALLVVSGMLKNPDVLRVIVAYSLGLIEKSDAAPTDSGEPAKVSEPVAVAAIPETQPAVPALASDIADALAGLMTPSPKVVQAAADAEFVEQILRDARKNPSNFQVSPWVN